MAAGDVIDQARELVDRGLQEIRGFLGHTDAASRIDKAFEPLDARHARQSDDRSRILQGVTDALGGVADDVEVAGHAAAALGLLWKLRDDSL